MYAGYSTADGISRPDVETTVNYDYIIVGAGSAGCVLANRLSADRSLNVLLLEAGGANESIYIDMPAALSIPMNRKRFNWGFRAAAEPRMQGRQLDCPRGRGLGGSSAINGMVYVRGHRRDFDRWAELGATGWSADDVAPYFERVEQVLAPQTGALQSELYERFLEAGEQAGFGRMGNLNQVPQEGVGLLPMTVRGGKRNSAKRGYLEPARQRHNLHVVTGALVDAVTFDGSVATGVRWRKRGRTNQASARQSVLLCAGAIGSPAILERSGVGDSERLQRLGINVVSHVPEVGEQLSDHLEVYVQHESLKPVSLHRWLHPAMKLIVGVRWLVGREGPGATNHFETGGFVRSDADAPWPDVQFHFLPAAMHYDGSQVAADHGYQIHTGPMLPESRGSVHIGSSDPSDAPDIQFNYLESARDRAVFRHAVRHARTIFAQAAFGPYRGEELAPGPSVQSDEALDAWIAANAESAYHPCGTCRMGSDERAVVDPAGRVRGVENLRVVDASIFPAITNGNLNAPTLMTAEKIAAELV